MLVGCLGKQCSRYYTLDKMWPFPPLSFAPGFLGLCFYELFSAGVAGEVLQTHLGGCRGAATLPPMCRTRHFISRDPVLPCPRTWDWAPQPNLQNFGLVINATDSALQLQKACQGEHNLTLLPQQRAAFTVQVGFKKPQGLELQGHST